MNRAFLGCVAAAVFSFSLTVSASQLLFKNVSVKAANVSTSATGDVLNVTSEINAPTVFGSVSHFVQDHVGLDTLAVGKLASRVITTTTPEGRALKAAVLAAGYLLGSEVSDSNGFQKPSSIKKLPSYTGDWVIYGQVVDPTTYASQSTGGLPAEPVVISGGPVSYYFKFRFDRPNQSPAYKSYTFSKCGVSGSPSVCPSTAVPATVTTSATGPSALGQLVNSSSAISKKFNDALAASPAIAKSNSTLLNRLAADQANIDSAKPTTSGGSPTTSNLSDKLRTSSTSDPSSSGSGGSATLPGKNTIIPSKPALSNSIVTVPGLSGSGTHLSKTCGTPWKTSVSLNNQSDPVSIPMKPFCQMATSLAPFVHAAALIGGIVIVAGGL